MRLVVQLSIVGALVLLAAATGSAAPRTSVTIFDSGIRPVQARVDVGGTVTWTNRGRARHTVISSLGAWRAFRLNPGRTRTVRLRRRGCEPYSVDRRFNGTILVGVRSCSAPGRGRTSGVTYRYDVRTEGFIEVEHISHSPQSEPGLVGVDRFTVRWTGTWRNVRVRKTSAAGGVYLLGYGLGPIRGELLHADNRPAATCGGRQVFTVPAARLAISGARQPNGRTSIGFDTQSTQALRPTVCRNHFPVPHEGPEVTVGGVKVMVADASQIVRFERMARRVLFPLTRLINGSSFTVDTGQRSERQECSPTPCTKTLRFRGMVRFTRRQP